MSFRMRRSAIALSVVALLMPGCSKFSRPTTSCAGSDASGVTIDLVRTKISDLAGVKESDDEPSLAKSKIRATVQQLALSLTDIRTTKTDPNSTKQFCTGTVRLVAPPDMIVDAESARQMAGLSGVEELADNANVEKNANVFTADINYNVQPTDNGEKIFSQIEDRDEAFRFFAELVKDQLLKSTVADAKAQTDRLSAEKLAVESNANRELAAASLEEAAASKATSDQAINAMWKALPSSTRERLLPFQRAWIKKKDATCKLEAASAGDENAMSVAMANCEARENNARTGFLEQQGQIEIQGDNAVDD